MKKSGHGLCGLVGLDGSRHAHQGLSFARQWADRTGGRLHLTVVAPSPKLALGPAGVAVAKIAAKNAEALIAREKAELSRKGISATGRVLCSANVAGSLALESRRMKSDFVVVGARGLSPVKAFFLGGVSQKLVGLAQRPVLVARGTPVFPGRVLLAVDGSDPSQRAADFLVRMGFPKSTTLFVQHVVPEGTQNIGGSPSPGGSGLSPLRRENQNMLMEAGRRQLGGVSRSLRPAFPGVKQILSEGIPAGEILSAARKTKADLIVLGARGLSKWDRFFIGSVSQNVLTHAPVSVLIVH